MREAWGRAVVEVAESDDRILMLDGDLANSTKADMFARAHPERFVQLGIAEQNMIGVAVGLADGGFIPWLSSFGVFFTHRALDPIRMLAAQTQANIKIAAAYTGLLTGLTGKTHHDVADLAIMRSMPDMTVLAPADADECAQAVRWASRHHGPVYLRIARDDVPVDFPASDAFRVGAVRRVRAGRDLTLVSTGAQSARVFGAAEQLAGRGIDCAVVHVPTIKPLDEQSLVDGIGSGGPLVVVEDHNKYGGLGGLVAEVLNRYSLMRNFKHIAVEDVWSESAPNDDLLGKHGLSSDSLANRLLQIFTESPAG
ncbi:transketolase family protein [Mycobacterium neglectum]|uniref:transketolase family protein n=1 Tax=Mycobacterium neglectum TaxID=242737 RepID=UPI00159BD4B2|nr:transketolase C-terminal domain-containing protein [Mycobacterium neglectum]